MNYRFYAGLIALVFVGCGGSGGIHSSVEDVSSNHVSSSTPSNQTNAHFAKALNDTGTDFCRAKTDETVDCLNAPSQDGNHGRDFLAANGELTKIGAGPLGFDWTKIATSGEPLANQQLAWQSGGSEVASTQWGCVQDNNTGLLWEVKSGDPANSHYYLLRYSWYDADSNPNDGSAGLENSDDCNGVACNTQAYIDYLNNLNYCGSSQWRLPTVNELMTIVVTANLDLVVDESYFPNTKNDQYLSNQTLASDRERAWYLYFSDGSTGYAPKTSPNYVRLVSKEVQ